MTSLAHTRIFEQRWSNAIWQVPLLSALVLPGDPTALFDGLPLASRAEVALLVVVIAGLMVLWREPTLPKKLKIILFALALISLGSKAATLVGPESQAFSACYITDTTGSFSQCEVSFADVYSSPDRTRWDQTLQFGANSTSGLRDGLTPWQLDFPTIENSKFDVNWKGPITLKGDASLRIESSAPIRLELSGSFVDDYEAGVHHIEGPMNGTLSLTFLGSQLIDPDPPIFRADVLRDGGEQPLRVTSSLSVQLLKLVPDIALSLTGLALAIRLIRRYRLALLFVGLIITSSLLLPVSIAQAIPALGPSGNGVSALSLAASLLIFAGIMTKRDRVAQVGAFAALTTISFRAIAIVGGWGNSLLRLSGDDWTAYQAFARQILAERSLRAGEDVFYYQPGYRYLLAGQRMIFGSSDLLPGILVVGLMLGALTYLIVSVSRLHLPPILRFACALVSAALILFATSDYLIRHAALGLSEPSAWLGIFGALALLAHSFRRVLGPSLSRIATVSVILGAVIVVRPNYLPPILGLLATIALLMMQQSSHQRFRSFFVLLSSFITPMCLVLAHNVWFGSAWTIVPTGANTVYDFPLRRLSEIFSDPLVRTEFVQKLAGFLGVNLEQKASILAAVPILGMFAGWCVMVASTKHTLNRNGLFFVVWPLLFLPPMVMFDTSVYFPRHVLGLPLTLAAVVLSGTLQMHVLQKEPGITKVQKRKPMPMCKSEAKP